MGRLNKNQVGVCVSVTKNTSVKINQNIQ